MGTLYQTRVVLIDDDGTEYRRDYVGTTIAFAILDFVGMNMDAVIVKVIAEVVPNV